MFVLIVLWSALLIFAGASRVVTNFNYADTLAKNEAIVSVKKDLAYRSWVASHGGVYVPITSKTPPNPYLSHIKNRDIHTKTGQHLTLMNPSYTLSQIMNDYSELYGTKGHITSRILTNPKNKADEWEEEVLKEAEKTGKGLFEKAFINNKEYLRYLSPLVVKESCLKCHAFQGYKVGDIRGGVSVSIPMDSYYEKALENSYIDMIIIFIIYIVGLSVILYAKVKAKEVLETKIKDYEQHVYSLVDIIEKRDSYTAGHTQRVAKYSVMIAKQMGFNKDQIDNIYRACMLHDIGKISTPDSILLKPGKLSELEYEIIKEHVVVSYELLKKVDIYKDIAEIIRHHHERYDGSGYPLGLKADQIPIMSHIMTVADAFDAMTTNRIYKAKKTVNIALEELNSLRAKQFHPEIVKHALIALKDVKIELNITQRPKSKIEQERFSYFYKDQNTGVYNRDYLEYVLAYNHMDEFNMNSIYVLRLKNFNQYNKKHSWAKGDELLRNFSNILKKIASNEQIFRIHGDDFIILSKEYFEIKEIISDLHNVLMGTQVSLDYSYFDIKKEAIQSISILEKKL